MYERLSSGQRINRASDDAAGLAIVSSLTTSKRVFTQGIRNLSDGVSLLNVADGAVEQLSSIVIRLKELAEQSANGIYGLKQRKAIDDESQALSKEYFRIARSTTFNGINLFFGETGEVRLQGGYGTDGGIASGLGGAIGTGTFVSGGTYLTELSGSLACSVGDLNNDGILDLVTAGSVFGIGTANVRLGAGNGTFGSAVSYATETGGSYVTESVRSNALSLSDLNGDGFLDLVTAGNDIVAKVTVRLGAGNGTFGSAVSYSEGSGPSNALAVGDLNGDGVLDLAATEGTVPGNVRIRLANTTSGISPLLSFKLTSRADALQALSLFDNKLDQLSQQRGTIGAFQARISVATNVLQATTENHAAAAGRIKDADVATEFANLVRTQILQQAASSVLAQANQQPALALQLLK